MSPEELRASLRKPTEKEEGDGRFLTFLDLMGGGEPEGPDPYTQRVVNIVGDTKIDKWEDERTKMTDEEWSDYLADTLSLAMGQCPKCFAPVDVNPLLGSKIVNSYSCTRFHEHTFIRAAPLNTDGRDEISAS